MPSLPVRGAWIEIVFADTPGQYDVSLPVRGAWIEIFLPVGPLGQAVVAPRKGSVD